MRSNVFVIESGETSFADLNALPCFSCLLSFFFFFFFKFRIEGPVWREGLGEKSVYILTGHRLKTDLQMQCEILLLMLVDSIMYLPFILSSFTKSYLVSSLADNKMNS